MSNEKSSKSKKQRGKTRRSFLKTGLMAGAAGLALIGTTPSKAHPQTPSKVFKWRLQSHLGPTEPGFAGSLTNFAKRVKEASGGRLDIQLFPADSLVPSKEILNSVSRQIVEMGSNAASYNSGVMPVVYTTLVPMGPRNAEDCAIIWQKGWGEILKAAYGKHGVKLLTMQIVNDIPLYSTKPVKTVEDFKGLKIRTHGSTALFVEKLGAGSAFIPGGEVYMALQTGAIDAATWGGYSTTFPKKWYEVAKYIIQPALVPMFQQDDLTINAKLFASLPNDLQQILQNAADLLMWDRRLIEGMGNDEAFAQMMAAGNQVITLPPDSVAKMGEAVKSVWDDLASRDEDSFKAMGIITDYLRSKGYTDYDIKKRTIAVKK